MGKKRGEVLEELIVKALRNIIAADPIAIGSILRYDNDNTFTDPKSIPDLQTINSLIGSGNIAYQQSTDADLDTNGNLDVSALVSFGNTVSVVRIDYDYTLVDPADNPIPSEPLTGYFSLFPQDVNGLLYISSSPPVGGTWDITVFATSLSIAPPPPPSNPVITLQPDATATIYEGRTLALLVAATGASGYQWRKNGVDIPGANTANLVINDFDVTDNASYTCYIYNGGGSVLSTACIASMFVPVAGQITIVNNSGTGVDWEDGGDLSIGAIADGGNKNKNPFVNGQYYSIKFYMNKKLNIKRYSNIGVLESDDTYDNPYFPDLVQYITAMDISKGYVATASTI